MNNYLYQNSGRGGSGSPEEQSGGVPGKAGRPKEPLKDRWHTLLCTEDYNVQPGKVSVGIWR